MEKSLQGFFLRQCPPYISVCAVEYIFVEFTWQHAPCFSKYRFVRNEGGTVFSTEELEPMTTMGRFHVLH
jgi:hypothetical protein